MSTTTTTAIIHNKPRRIVVDCDPGIDDAWALLMLCKAETAAHPIDHRLVAVTCVHGNTSVQNAAANVAQVLMQAGRTDIPVYIGASTGLIPPPPRTRPPYHGHNGLGDVYAPLPADHPALQCIQRDEHAVHALHRLATEGQQLGQPITLVGLGPLTNIALAIRMYGSEFVRSIGEVWMMGGNHQGIGNVADRVCAEFNFYNDPEAAHIVLEAFGAASIPTFVLPWETCIGLRVPIRWRWDQLGTIKHPLLEWLNPVDRSIFGRLDSVPGASYVLCDAQLASCMLWPERLVGQMTKRRCTVELQGTHTRGMMVVDRKNGELSPVPENVWMLEALSAEGWNEAMLWLVDAAATTERNVVAADGTKVEE